MSNSSNLDVTLRGAGVTELDMPFTSMVSPAERIQTLRQRCRARKQHCGGWQYRRILAAQSLKQSDGKPWQVRAGLRELLDGMFGSA